MDGLQMSGLPVPNKYGEEESIEGYLKAWDAIKGLNFGPSHVNLASEIADRFMNGGHFANMVHFVNSLDEGQFEKLKDNEKFERALIELRMAQRKYQDVFELLETGYFQNKEGLLEIWDKAHYKEHEARMGKPLNALLRYRIRQRFLPPEHICLNGSRPTARLPDKALKILKMWLLEHPKNPYPSKLDKNTMIQDSGLSLSQVRTWFANARRRIRLRKEKLRKARFRSEADASSELDGCSDSQDDLSSGDHMSGEDCSSAVDAVSKIDTPRPQKRQLPSMTSFDLSKISYNDEALVPFDNQSSSLTPEPLQQDLVRKESVKNEVLSNIEVSGHPSAKTVGPLFKMPGTSSSSFRPCYYATHTSQFLNAMAGMCEDISPVTYQLGAPRVSVPKYDSYQPPAPEFLGLQTPRSAYQHPTIAMQDGGGYRYFPGQFQPPVYPQPRPDYHYGDEFPKAKKMFQQANVMQKQEVVSLGSRSAPPGLGVLGSSHFPLHPENGLTLPVATQTFQPSPWPAYPTRYNGGCYLCYSSVGRCAVCKPLSSLRPSEAISSHLPPFAMLMTDTCAELPKVRETKLPVAMATETTCQSDQMFRHWMPQRSSSITPTGSALPSFTSSFVDIRGTESLRSLELGQQAPPSARMSPSFRQAFEQRAQTNETMPSRRCSSCPSRPAVSLSSSSSSSSSYQLHHRRSNSPTVPKMTCATGSYPDSGNTSARPGVSFRCPIPPFYANGDGQGHARTMTSTASLPPQAHSNHGNHQEWQSPNMEMTDNTLDSWKSITDGRPQSLYLAEDSGMAFSPQTGEGIKEIAQVLLDLSTKGSKSEQMIR